MTKLQIVGGYAYNRATLQREVSMSSWLFWNTSFAKLVETSRWRVGVEPFSAMDTLKTCFRGFDTL